MKAYVSSRLKYRARARELRDALEAVGIRVTSTWIDLQRGQGGSPQEIALRDSADLRRADVLVVLNHCGSHGGVLWETGAAWERGMRIIHIAQDRSPGEVFLWLPEVEYVRTIPEAIQLLTTKRRSAAA